MTTVDTGTLACGVYTLTSNQPALQPDKRKRYDWRAAPVTAGTQLVVRDEGDYGRMLGLLRGFFQGVPVSTLPETFCAALEPVAALTPSQHLRAADTHMLALDILDRLAATGLITLGDVQAAEAAILAED